MSYPNPASEAAILSRWTLPGGLRVHVHLVVTHDGEDVETDLAAYGVLKAEVGEASLESSYHGRANAMRTIVLLKLLALRVTAVAACASPVRGNPSSLSMHVIVMLSAINESITRTDGADVKHPIAKLNERPPLRGGWTFGSNSGMGASALGPAT